jgi:hypothetical protein
VTGIPQLADTAARLAMAAGCDGVEAGRISVAILTDHRPVLPDRLREQYVRMTDRGMALRLIGRRHEIHPRDVVAFRHRHVGVADLSEFLNREWYGHEIAGRVMLDNGILIVLDLRPSLRRQNIPVTDPVRPDDWSGR